MSAPIKIDQVSKTPKYQQISRSIVTSIDSGILSRGAKLPSINEICKENGLARETVVKAFDLLRQQGLITSIHGKGFYVSSTRTSTTHRVFILLDTLSPYKEVLISGLKTAFGEKAIIDLYFHHFNIDVFRNTIAEYAGSYTSYIILPFEHKRIGEALLPLKDCKAYYIDVRPKALSGEYCGIYQDFRQDIIDILGQISPLIRKYHTFHLIFRNTITIPPIELEAGFRWYCENHEINFSISYNPVKAEIRTGEGYLVIDDEDLVTLVENAKARKVTIGKDIGIISYNETSLKKVVADGISVISTDFSAMGHGIAKMIISNERRAIRNATSYIDRHSF